MHSEKDNSDNSLFRGVLWLNAKVLGLSCGILLGMVIFVSTNWLILKGGSNVGQHLRLLSHFFLGYNTTFIGSLIGFAYGFALGTFLGALFAWIYNKIAAFRN